MLVNEINVLLICLKTLCVKNKVLSCSTFLMRTNSENDCELYNKKFIDFACSVCTVKYRTSVFLVLRTITLAITLINKILLTQQFSILII